MSDHARAKFETMKNIGAKIVLSLDALLFGAFGLLYCLKPDAMAASVGLQMKDTGAVIDVVGLYGGLELGLGLFILSCLVRGDIKTGLRAGSFTLSGIALARIFAILRLGMPAQSVLMLVCLDSFGALMNVVLLLKERSRNLPRKF